MLVHRAHRWVPWGTGAVGHDTGPPITALAGDIQQQTIWRGPSHKATMRKERKAKPRTLLFARSGDTQPRTQGPHATGAWVCAHVCVRAQHRSSVKLCIAYISLFWSKSERDRRVGRKGLN